MRLPDPLTGDELAVALSLSVVFALVLAPIGAGVVLATHDEERTTQGFKTYTPGGEIPKPGETYTVELYSTPSFMEEEGPIPSDVEFRLEYKKYYSTTKSHCSAEDVYALGIDRGNDQPGTKYDEDMLQKLMEDGRYNTGPEDDPGKMTSVDSWDHRTVNWLRFPQPDDFTDPLRLHRDGVEDELIVASEGCVEMPAAGWHRTFTYMNGTILEFHSDRESVTIDGEEYQEGDHFEIWESAAWYPVCECDESRHVAMRLDPPPGKMLRGSEGGIYHPNGTVEAPYASVDEEGNLVYPDFTVPPENVTSEGIHFHDGFLELTGPIIYDEGRVEADGTIVTPQGERIEPEDDESPPPPTATPTPTASATDTPDDTTEDTPAPTETLSEATDGEDGDDGDDGSGDDDPATTGDSSNDDGPPQEGSAGTPTPGDGAGFGAVAALAALLAAAVYLGRRG